MNFMSLSEEDSFLTKNDIDVVSPFVALYNKALDKNSQDIDAEEIKAQINAQGLNVSQALSVAKKLIDNKWFTVIPDECKQGFLLDDGTLGTVLSFSALANFKTARGHWIRKKQPNCHSIILRGEPASDFSFFDNKNTFTTIYDCARQNLKLDKGYKAIDSFTFFVLDAILETFSGEYNHELSGAPILTTSILTQKYIPLFTNAFLTDFTKLTREKLKKDKYNNTATYKFKNGNTVTVTEITKLLSALSVSSKKILNYALFYLLQSNYYRGKTVIPTVEMPLKEYAELTGADVFPKVMPTQEAQQAEDKRTERNLKKFKADIRKELSSISELKWTGEEHGKGPTAGDYADIRIISSHKIIRGFIRVNFDPDAAAYFLKSYVFFSPTILFSLDNRNINAFAILQKICIHYSNDSNFASGTNTTLSVVSLLNEAPEIPTLDNIKATNNRNWKAKIKGVLEKSLDLGISYNILGKWEYRDPTTRATYTKEQANSLTYNQWYRLMVDYTVIGAPDQTERRAAKAEAKKAALEKGSGQPKKKRGRPRKKTENEEKVMV